MLCIASVSQPSMTISTLPKSLRARLAAEGYRSGFPAIDQRFVSRDGTVRYLVRFSDAQTVETVWMPDGDGAEETEEFCRDHPGAAHPTGAPPSASPPRPDAP